MSKDENHVWNDKAPILTSLQGCGCHITPESFELCQRGRDLKKSVDSYYNMYYRQKDTPIDAKIKAAHFVSFEIHRRIYLKHLETGRNWPL